jgi:nitroreductase
VHQRRKKGQILEIMRRRYSERIFSDREVEIEKIQVILEMCENVPSSCNRRAIDIKVIDSRDDRQILSGLLVGGVGWIHRASKILLLIADMRAYKEQLFYMPYLDAGVIVQQIYLVCTELGLGCCFVNPNIRVDHYPLFDTLFCGPEKTFCGVVAIGYKDQQKT